jgi:hypothetical protein
VSKIEQTQIQLNAPGGEMFDQNDANQQSLSNQMLIMTTLMTMLKALNMDEPQKTRVIAALSNGVAETSLLMNGRVADSPTKLERQSHH